MPIALIHHAAGGANAFRRVNFDEFTYAGMYGQPGFRRCVVGGKFWFWPGRFFRFFAVYTAAVRCWPDAGSLLFCSRFCPRCKNVIVVFYGCTSYVQNGNRLFFVVQYCMYSSGDGTTNAHAQKKTRLLFVRDCHAFSSAAPVPTELKGEEACPVANGGRVLFSRVDYCLRHATNDPAAVRERFFRFPRETCAMCNVGVSMKAPFDDTRMYVRTYTYVVDLHMYAGAGSSVVEIRRCQEIMVDSPGCIFGKPCCSRYAHGSSAFVGRFAFRHFPLSRRGEIGRLPAPYRFVNLYTYKGYASVPINCFRR